ncbi:MAG: hypothetical protein ABIR62_11535 [Dokdonella sp.]|uniref:hypothetical protein n=1 Tax=Dokdonella sp. TaxID=2291710 RepID=UPI003265C2FE
MQTSKGWETLSVYDQKLFLNHGPSALARRGKPYVASRRALWFDWLLTGTLGLLGIFLFGWSSGEAALLLVASFWLGWLADLLLLSARSKALAISYRNAVDDMRFWQIVAVLRGKRRIPADARSHPTLGLSLIIDLVSGSTATVLLLSGLAKSGVAPSELTGSASLLASIAAIALGTVKSLRSRLQRAADGRVELPEFRAGQRGIGLLIVVFALMGLGGGRLPAHLIVGTVSSFFVIVSVIELIWGVPELIREAEWVSEHSTLSKVEVDCPP